MSLAKLSSRRFWAYLLVLAVTVCALVWFIPAVRMAKQKAPVHNEVGIRSLCADETLAPPDYGSREPVNPCLQ